MKKLKCGCSGNIGKFYLDQIDENTVEVRCGTCLEPYRLLREEVWRVERIKGNLVEIFLCEAGEEETSDDRKTTLRIVRNTSKAAPESEKGNVLIADAKRRVGENSSGSF